MSARPLEGLVGRTWATVEEARRAVSVAMRVAGGDGFPESILLVRMRLGRYAIRVVPVGASQAAVLRVGDLPLRLWLGRRSGTDYTPIGDRRSYARHYRGGDKQSGFSQGDPSVANVDLRIPSRSSLRKVQQQERNRVRVLAFCDEPRSSSEIEEACFSSGLSLEIRQMFRRHTLRRLLIDHKIVRVGSDRYRRVRQGERCLT